MVHACCTVVGSEGLVLDLDCYEEQSNPVPMKDSAAEKNQILLLLLANS